ncbi:hypothetical protein D3C77_357800 [compost metagenome]
MGPYDKIHHHPALLQPIQQFIDPVTFLRIIAARACLIRFQLLHSTPIARMVIIAIPIRN